MSDVSKDVVASNSISSIFVTEDDRFSVTLKYRNKNDKLWVEGIDEGDVNTMSDVGSISMAFKYPSHGDYRMISMNKKTNKSPSENFDMDELNNLEFARMSILLRSWSLFEQPTFENLLRLPPRVIKGIILKVREVIGFEGII